MNKLQGLSSKIDEINQIGNERIINIKIDDLILNDNNFYSQNDIERLAKVIELSGKILIPIIVRKEGNNYIVVDGERRVKAASLLKMEFAPAIIANDINETNLIKKFMIFSNQYRELTVDDRVKQYEVMEEILIEEGVKNVNETLAQLFGVSERTIYRDKAATKQKDIPIAPSVLATNNVFRSLKRKLINNVMHFETNEIDELIEILQSEKENRGI